MFAHGERYEDAGSGPTGHPELEEIAALVDGRLAGPRAERLRSHLASCAECREVFLGTVDFLREEEAEGREADPRPFESRIAMTPPIVPRPPAARWLSASALTAAAVAGVWIGLAVYRSAQTPPNIAAAVEKLAEGAAKPAFKAKIAGKGPDRFRGPNDARGPIEQVSARLGSSLVDLAVSLEGQDFDEADAAVARINGVNAALDLPEKGETRAYFVALRGRLKALEANVRRPEIQILHFAGHAKEVKPLIAETDRVVRRGYKKDVVYPLYVDLGRWAEAGKLAVLVKDERFLQLRDVRRFPPYFQRHAEVPIEPEAIQAMDVIERILDQRKLGEADYKTLADEYDKILRIYG